MPCTPPQGLRCLQAEVKLHPKGGGKRGERRGERGEEDRNENQLIEEGEKKEKMWRAHTFTVMIM